MYPDWSTIADDASEDMRLLTERSRFLGYDLGCFAFTEERLPRSIPIYIFIQGKFDKLMLLRVMFAESSSNYSEDPLLARRDDESRAFLKDAASKLVRVHHVYERALRK